MKITVITPSIRPKGLEITRKSLLEQTFRDFEWLIDVNCTGEHDLNRSFNALLKRSKGELIVILQDYIKIAPDALQRLWDSYSESPNTFFTCPVGKVKDLAYEDTPKWDWRHFKEECHWQGWEIDFGACPRAAIFAIGGFDEELDKFWSCDNVNVGCRADLAGYKFKCLKDIEALAWDHDAFVEHPFRDRYNPTLNNKRMDEFRRGLTLDYLKD